MFNSLLKRALAAAWMAALPSVSPAVHIGDGEGQALIYPFYSVNNGLATLLQVNNHTGEVKALSIRFLEGNNGREVLGFNIYLKPHDTWTAALGSTSVAGPARIMTADPTCTVPAIPASGVDLRNFLYGSASPGSADGGSTSLHRTREGHIEIIEMGVVGGNLASAAVNGDCITLNSAWIEPGGAWVINPSADMSRPTGGLAGAASLVAVEEGVIYSYRAVALDGFSGIVQNHSPGALLPNLSKAAGGSPEANVTATWLTSDGTPQSATWPRNRAIDAVSAVLSRVSVSNRFTQENGLSAETEWVLNFPTKAFYTDNQPGGRITGNPLAPFQVAFSGAEPLTRSPYAGGACTFHALDVRNREGVQANVDPEMCIPLDPECGAMRLAACHVTQVVSLGHAEDTLEASPLLASLRMTPYRPAQDSSGRPPPPAVSRAPAGDFESGYVTLELEGTIRPSNEGLTPHGLPVIALGLERIVNGNALPGRLANYAAAVPHSGRSEVGMEGTDPR